MAQLDVIIIMKDTVTVFEQRCVSVCECQVTNCQNCEKLLNMENGVNFAVPWEVKELKSFQLQGLRPLTLHPQSGESDLLIGSRSALVIGPGIPYSPLTRCWGARINTVVKSLKR